MNLPWKKRFSTAWSCAHADGNAKPIWTLGMILISACCSRDMRPPYITGKNELERLMADRAMQLGDTFNLQEFYGQLFCLRDDPHLSYPMGNDRT